MFTSEFSHHDNFLELSYHYSNDRRRVRDFMDADVFRWRPTFTPFFKWTPSTNADIFSRY